jgi:hypothetical protein
MAPAGGEVPTSTRGTTVPESAAKDAAGRAGAHAPAAITETPQLQVPNRVPAPALEPMATFAAPPTAAVPTGTMPTTHMAAAMVTVQVDSKTPTAARAKPAPVTQAAEILAGADASAAVTGRPQLRGPNGVPAPGFDSMAPAEPGEKPVAPVSALALEPAAPDEAPPAIPHLPTKAGLAPPPPALSLSTRVQVEVAPPKAEPPAMAALILPTGDVEAAPSRMPDGQRTATAEPATVDAGLAMAATTPIADVPAESAASNEAEQQLAPGAAPGTVDKAAVTEPTTAARPEPTLVPDLPAAREVRPAVATRPVAEPAPANEPRLPVEQIPMRIAQAAVRREHRITIRLDPPDLGRVDIVLDTRQDLVHVAMAVERPETLELLRRDLQLLDQALARANVRLDGAPEFSLQQGTQHRFGGQAGDGRHQPYAAYAARAGDDEGMTPGQTRQVRADHDSIDIIV